MKSCSRGKLRPGGGNKDQGGEVLRATVLLLSLVLTGCGSLGAVGTIGTLGAIGTVGAYEVLGTRTGTAAANNDTAIRKIKIGASRKPEEGY
jgi:hypothetical protein